MALLKHNPDSSSSMILKKLGQYAHQPPIVPCHRSYLSHVAFLPYKAGKSPQRPEFTTQSIFEAVERIGNDNERKDSPTDSSEIDLRPLRHIDTFDVHTEARSEERARQRTTITTVKRSMVLLSDSAMVATVLSRS